jgi:hypothetical protein
MDDNELLIFVSEFDFSFVDFGQACDPNNLIINQLINRDTIIRSFFHCSSKLIPQFFVFLNKNSVSITL